MCTSLTAAEAAVHQAREAHRAALAAPIDPQKPASWLRIVNTASHLLGEAQEVLEAAERAAAPDYAHNQALAADRYYYPAS